MLRELSEQPRRAHEQITRATLGRFILEDSLGSGGMGLVYSAYDPTLKRRIALKVIPIPFAKNKTDEGMGSQVLLREAQAMARLSHPNVVTVHDAGIEGDAVWIAMEHVLGQTLRSWIHERPRKWSETMRVLADAARGVAAAHSAGLIHRDLKPDNIMIDGEGRVRVLDFGLAHSRAEVTDLPDLAETVPASQASGYLRSARLESSLTPPGPIMGTPGYMAPEQRRGGEVGPAADQFSWCVMAWELLYGDRPRIDECASERSRIDLGSRRERPMRRHAPNWVREIIERGLSAEPYRRWPSMHALLEALASGRTRARLRATALSIIGISLLALVVWGVIVVSKDRSIAACKFEGEALSEAIWSGRSSEQIFDVFSSANTSYAAETAEKLTPWLERYASEWKEAYTLACVETRVNESWSPEIFSRAHWCLAERRMEFEHLVRAVVEADSQLATTMMSRAVSAAASLPGLSPCRDAKILSRLPVPPLDVRRDIGTLRETLAHVSALGRTGQYKEGLLLAKESVAKAGLLSWPPINAAAKLQLGILLELNGDFAGAEDVLEQVFFDAEHINALEIVADSGTALVMTVGDRLARFRDGLRWSRHTQNTLARLDEQDELRQASLMHSTATVYLQMGNYDNAMKGFQDALTIREALLGVVHPTVANTLNNIAIVQAGKGDYRGAKISFARALSIRESALGVGHPEVGKTLHNLAGMHMAMGEYSVAARLQAQALKVRQAALGPEHTDVASSLLNLGIMLNETGRSLEARDLIQQAQAIWEKKVGGEHPDIAHCFKALAAVYLSLGDLETAQSLYGDAIDMQIRMLGSRHPTVASSIVGLANVKLALGEPSEAQELDQRALEIMEETYAEDHPEFASVLLGLAAALTAQRKADQALSLAERAVRIRERANMSGKLLGDAYLALARALWEAGQDYQRATRIAEQARGLYREGQGKECQIRLAEVEEWLATHKVEM